MRFFFGRRELRLEEGGDKEAMRGRFKRANFSLRAAGDYGKTGFHGAPFVVGIDFEVAEEFFGHDFLVFAVERLQVGPGTEANLWYFAGQLRCVTFAPGDGAGHGVDDDILRAGIVFGAVGIGDAENVAGKLDQGVLKTSACTEKRPIAVAGEFDASKHALETLVGTAGRSPEAVKAFEDFFCALGDERRRRYPFRFKLQLHFFGSVLQGLGGGVVGTEIRIEVTEDSDANRIAHWVIVLERATVNFGEEVRRLVRRVGVLMLEGEIRVPFDFAQGGLSQRWMTREGIRDKQRYVVTSRTSA